MLTLSNAYKNEKIEGFIARSKKELEEYFGFTWNTNFPGIVFIPDRETIDAIKGFKTEDWVIGWANGSVLYYLQPENFEKESSHKYTDNYYCALIKHELTHAFCGVYSESTDPMWFFEGLAVYLSGQIGGKEIQNLDHFFSEPYTWTNEYNDAGLLAAALDQNYGKKKIIQYLKATNIKGKDFKELFNEVFGLEFTQTNIKSLLAQNLKPLQV